MAPVVDFAARFSLTASRRRPSPLRDLFPLLDIPGIISLGGGLPNPRMFPFKYIEIGIVDVAGNVPGETATSPASLAPLRIDGERLDIALQYTSSYGLPPLLAQLRALQERIHVPFKVDARAANIPAAMMVTTGSQDALSKAFEMLLNDGDALLVEEPTYSGALSALLPHSTRLVGVASDADGIVPESLASVLRSEYAATDGRRPPRLLYTIPNGQNPSGSSTSQARREAIYKLVCEYDLLLLEDDPYYYLQFSDAPAQSYMALDTENRVLRFDSFSKVMSSGMRFGWVTGPKPLVDRMQLEQQHSALHVSGVTQTIVITLLERWGDAGFDHHVRAVQAFYRQRRDVFLRLADKHLTGLARWAHPSAGMFVWLELLTVEDSHDLITRRAVDAKVILVFGSAFEARPGGGARFVRASYSIATDEEMDEALRRFASLLPPLPAASRAAEASATA